ncbi:MAG: nitrile hydratase subunit beta [Betaproteobacteria bacterium]|nr:nitrile hydratase subunit beta [Betaproteobacteria bacterium]
MSDKPANRGPHDMGGEVAGPVDTTDHGMRFWEKQANAMRNVLTGKKVVRTDELRRAAEALGERYYRLAYFERTTEALRTLLLEKGIVTEAGLNAKMAEVRARFDVPPESESPVKKRVRR